jgi:uncharacterized protein YdaU (DUF1376 family)
MHYYSHHIDSYTSSTRHLTPMEDLAYRRMLEVYYRDEGPLQGDAATVARRIGLREFVESVAVVLAEFFTETEAGWRQERCEEELAHYRQVVERNRANGNLGGRPRKPSGLPSGSQSVASRNPVATQSKPTGNPPNPTPNPNPTPTSEPNQPAQSAVASLHGAGSASKQPAQKPDDVPGDLWAEWQAFRKSKRAPVTQRVLDDTRKKASEAGMTMAEALTHWIAQGYIGFFPPRDGNGGKRPDGGFDRFGNWKGVPRGKQDYSNVITEDDPLGMHPKQLLARENGIRASKSLPPLTMEQWEAENPPGTY